MSGEMEILKVFGRRAAQEMIRTAEAAKRLGVTIVNGFTGSPIWHLNYSFPPVTPAMIEEGLCRLCKTMETDS